MDDDAERITTLAELEALYGAPVERSLLKETDHLTPAYRRWLEAAPFFAIATVGPEGLDCSPRGDRQGQVLQVVDDRTLLIPDRRGNNRIDTLRNIVRDPRLALLFFIPGVNETLRINGSGSLTAADHVRARFAVAGQMPATALIVKIVAVYFQCARARMRSALWDHAARDGSPGIPTAGEMTRDACGAFDAGAYDAALPDRQRATLY